MVNNSKKNQQLISLVIPLFNEGEVVTKLLEKLNTFLPKLNKTVEVIFVNDGSKDSTVDKLINHKTVFNKKIISFSRNFGHQAAVLAGMEHTVGDIIITIDGDLQHPLEIIPEMIAYHDKGVDIVLTKRVDGNETSTFKKKSALLFYSLLNSISTQKIGHNSSDFRSLNRKALTALLSLPEKRKFLRGMVQWIGFTTVTIPFNVHKRVSGSSKYSLSKMIKLAFEGITSFSTTPLYISAFVGLLLFLLAFVYAIYVIYIRFFHGNAVEGWASVLFVLLVVGGFISLFLGIIGLYIAAIYDEVKNRPSYIVSETYNIKE